MATIDNERQLDLAIQAMKKDQSLSAEPLPRSTALVTQSYLADYMVSNLDATVY
jgi:hypothetical protein